jgi:Uncharacterized Zn-finger containing protein
MFLYLLPTAERGERRGKENSAAGQGRGYPHLYTCPACGTVLVRLKTGELYCANCERAVVLVKTEEEAQQALEVIQLRR